MKKISIIISILLFSVNAFSQMDKELWFAVPDISSSYNVDGSIKINFVSYGQTTTVRVSQPACADGTAGVKGIDTTFTMPPNSFKVLDLGTKFKSQLEVFYGLAVPFALHITADNNVTAYYANTSDDSEVYTLKGKNALGTDFIVPMQNIDNSGTYYKPAYNSIEILATEDNTTVTVDLLVWTLDQLQTTPKQTMTIHLNKGWCYAFAAKGSLGSEHLDNTHIKSDKPIAVNSTDDSAGYGDLIGDQLVPTSLGGTAYIALKNLGTTDRVFIYATKNNTPITINGTLFTTLNAGQKTMYALTAPATYITTPEGFPIIAFQETCNPGNYPEFGGAILPNINCTGSMEAAYKPAFKSSGTNIASVLLDIVTRKADIGNFNVNKQTGIINASDFTAVPGTSDAWYYCRKEFKVNDAIMLQNDTILRLKNTSGYFQLGIVDYKSGTNSCSFGYISDFHPIELKAETSTGSTGTYLANQTITLNLLNASAFSGIVWTYPDRVTKYTGNPLIIPNATSANAGIYEVNASIECNVPAPAYVVVNVLTPQVYPTLKICSGDSQILSSNGYGPYTWTSTPYVGLPNSSAVTVSPTITGLNTYNVINYKKGQNIIFNGNFQEPFVKDKYFSSDYFYGGSGTTAVSTSGNYSVWKNARTVNNPYDRVYDHTIGDGNKGYSLISNCTAQAGAKLWTKTVDVIPNTQYNLSAWFITASKAGAQAHLRFSINGVNVGNMITPPNTVSSGTYGTKPEHWKKDSCTWNSGQLINATISIITDASTTLGSSVCIDDIEFAPLLAITDKFNVNVLELPKPKIKGDTIICSGRPAAVLHAGRFSNGNPFSTYSWYKTDNPTQIIGTDSIYPAIAPGKYGVEVSNDICNAKDSFNVAPSDELKISLDSVVQICPTEPNFSLNYQITRGEVKSYNVLFDQQATGAGFVSGAIQPSGNQLDFPLNNAPSGTYKGELTITGKSVCVDIRKVPITVTVNIDSKYLMAQKWNNVIALYNKDHNLPYGYTYTAYQWYKNGVPMVGETNAYIYLGSGIQFDPNDKYSLMLTRTDGVTFRTCDFQPIVKALIMPTLVAPSQVISVQQMSVTGTATFSDLSGLIYSRQVIDQNNSQLQVPAKKGWYVLDIATNEENIKFKMVVR